ncbi:alpha-hydroxy acid oxidase [Saccharomonospora sp. NPDC046836]|uniref:alpha-hydroxy acid oxidase n=1 Tax=Saccharomonospora sp. NPDC046836 TaxID=3156921 RepID=UPI0033D4B678
MEFWSEVDDLRSVDAYREQARTILPPRIFGLMFGTERDPVGRTDAANRAAFDAVQLRPRVLIDVSTTRVTTRILGHDVALPVMLAPIGAAARVHPDGELASARAAGSHGVITVVSAVSSHGLGAVNSVASGPVWSQLYFLRDRGLLRTLVEHAVRTGCAALVVTVDNPGVVTQERARLRSAEGQRAWGTFAELELPALANDSGLLVENVDPALTWRDLEWLRSLTDLPIVVKGIQTAEDARLCAQLGFAGLVVSNHGGHCLPDTRGTAARLPEIVAAAGEVEVYLDGGIRHGLDVLKALALGARAVLIGRAQYWGLAVAGQAGLSRVLGLLTEELIAAMRLCGVPDIGRLSPALVHPAPAEPVG